MYEKNCFTNLKTNVEKSLSNVNDEDKILIFFQPHLYTRTRDFESGFVKSLAQFDQIGILPIYEAREHPIDGVNSNVLVSKIKLVNADVALIQPNQIFETIATSDKRIVLMVGAGDIGEMVTKVTRQFEVQ